MRFDHFDSGGVYTLHLRGGQELTIIERKQREDHVEGWEVDLFSLGYDNPVQDLLDSADTVSIRYKAIDGKVFHGPRRDYEPTEDRGVVEA